MGRGLFRTFLLPGLLAGWALALAGCAGEGGNAGISASRPDADATALLSIRGKIQPRLYDELTRLVPDQARPEHAILHLHSGGGDFNTALRLARWVRALPRSTVVVDRACDSACVMIFAAATERLVTPTATFAVHGPQCSVGGLWGLPCETFWIPWARNTMRETIARGTPQLVAWLDTQDPPAFELAGRQSVRVTGAQLIALGAATRLTRATARAALD